MTLKYTFKSRLALGLCLCFALISCTKTIKDEAGTASFIDLMVLKHAFDRAKLVDLFDEAVLDEGIVKKISKPSESLPWHRYRKIFLKVDRIKAGAQFWQDHEKTLAAVEQDTGVPAAIIVAIIGVETIYGRHTGNYRVIDALSTLAFAYPPRSAFFRAELENFLLLCREQKINPLKPTGSYAGAMGMPQFMPSSYRHYAIDFNNDNYRDIWRDPEDTIASVGHYLAQHGWKKGRPVAHKFNENKQISSTPDLPIKDDLSLVAFNSENPNISTPLLSPKKAKIIALEQEDGEELWATSENFYVITQYNHSPLYAMAVYQLSLALANQFHHSSLSSSYEKYHFNTHHPGTLRVF
jgi:membrane-bound lytic murein transglycosylase B